MLYSPNRICLTNLIYLICILPTIRSYTGFSIHHASCFPLRYWELIYTSAIGTVTFEPLVYTSTCSLPTTKLSSEIVLFLITIQQHQYFSIWSCFQSTYPSDIGMLELTLFWNVVDGRLTLESTKYPLEPYKQNKLTVLSLECFELHYSLYVLIYIPSNMALFVTLITFPIISLNEPVFFVFRFCSLWQHKILVYFARC